MRCAAGPPLGIVGYGNIGTQLSVLAENLGMSVYFYDVADKLAIGNARRCAFTLAELLESVETVTLHVDGRDGNRGFFGASEASRDAAALAVPQLVPRVRGGPRGAAQQYRVRAPRRGGRRRLPRRAEGRRR